MTDTFSYQPYSPATAAQVAARYGTVRATALAGGHEQLDYYDPQGRKQDTGSGTVREYVIQLFRAMRAGVIPWVSERARQNAYKAHGQPVPPAGSGLASDKGLYGAPTPRPHEVTLLPIVPGGHHAARTALGPSH